MEVSVIHETLGQTVVVLNHVDTLSPIAAKAARNIAFGLGAHVTVTDGRKTYRVTRHTVRRIKETE